MKITVLSGIFIGFLVQFFLLFHRVNWKDDFSVDSQGNKFFEIGWPLQAKYVPFIESNIRESSNLAEMMLFNTFILALVYIVFSIGYMKLIKNYEKRKQSK